MIVTINYCKLGLQVFSLAYIIIKLKFYRVNASLNILGKTTLVTGGNSGLGLELI